MREAATEHSLHLPGANVTQLRALAHDLSNSLETILQAAYLLNKSKLEANSANWARLIDSAARDAARINREITNALNSQS